jgi:hypothetical protein
LARSRSKRSEDPAKCTAFVAGEHRGWDCQETDLTGFKQGIANKEQGRVKALAGKQLAIGNKIWPKAKTNSMSSFKWRLLRHQARGMISKDLNAIYGRLPWLPKLFSKGN